MTKKLTKKNSLTRKAKLILKKAFGALIVVLIVAFVAYHLYSVGNFVKNFNASTGRQTSSK